MGSATYTLRCAIMECDDMSSNINFHEVFLGALLVGFGHMVTFIASPRLYHLLSREIANPGTGLSVDDFPIGALQPPTQWLLDTVGAFGLAFLLATIGLSIMNFGWQRLLRSKFG